MTATIRTEGLTKRYGRTTALDALDLEVDAGEVFGYLGPNGAGKSTTIALLLGLIRATAGGGPDLRPGRLARRPAIHRRLAYVPSEANLWPSLTGAEALRFLGNIHGSVDDRLPRRARRALRAAPRQEDPRLQPRQPAEGPADRRVRQPRRPARCSTSPPPASTR